MGFIFKTIAVVFVVLAVTNYVIYQRTGNLPAREWVSSATKVIDKTANSKEISLDTSTLKVSTLKVSKWTDAKGVVHYENRPVDGAKTIEVDPNVNVLSSPPVVKLPDDKKDKPKTMNEEVQELQKAKDAYYESVINN